VRIHDAQLSQTAAASPSGGAKLTTVRTLQAHSAGATGCAIVERGKNVVSFGRDATVRLWNVGEGKEIVGRRWRAPRGSPVLCGCVEEKWQEVDYDSEGGVVEAQRNPPGTLLDGEVGTRGKVVFIGLQDGSVRGYTLSTGEPVFYSSGTASSLGGKTSPVDSICYSRSTSTLAAGRRDGSIMAWDLRSINRSLLHSQSRDEPGRLSHDEFFDSSPSWTLRRNSAGVECLYITETVPTGLSSGEETVGLLVGSADGLFCRVGLKLLGEVILLEEFIGIESGDGVRGIQCVVIDESEMVWCAADDGLVRRY
jgi:WD40 repeat protein